MKNKGEQSSMRGRVIASYSNRYDVNLEQDHERYQCQVRGNLKKAGIDVRVGDCVILDQCDTSNKLGRIVNVEPRKNELSRPKISNVDQVVIVHPVAQPAFDAQQLDRYLVHAALHQLPVIICLTKVDLLKAEDALQELEQWLSLYQTQLAYFVFVTSINDEDSLLPFIEACRGKISVLAGLSGAGKSTLLNHLNPQLALQTGEVSDKLERGQHTTRHTELLEPLPQMWVADTPGFSHLQFAHVEPLSIQSAFPELEALECGFPDCLHRGEEQCALSTASEENHSQDFDAFEGESPHTVTPPISPTRLSHYHLFIDESESGATERESMSQKIEKGEKSLSAKGGAAQRRVRVGARQRAASRRQKRQALTEYTHLERDDWELDDSI